MDLQFKIYSVPPAKTIGHVPTARHTRRLEAILHGHPKSKHVRLHVQHRTVEVSRRTLSMTRAIWPSCSPPILGNQESDKSTTGYLGSSRTLLFGCPILGLGFYNDHKVG